MKALTICQPWAWAIVRGTKRIENRSWPTGYRGWLAIHAGKSRAWLTGEPLPDGTAEPSASSLVFGAVVGVAWLANCAHIGGLSRNWAACGAGREQVVWAEGPWCWLLEDVTALAEPLPWRGAQGLWEIEDEALRAAGWRPAERRGRC